MILGGGRAARRKFAEHCVLKNSSKAAKHIHMNMTFGNLISQNER